MRTITLKSVPDELYESLKEAARRNRRSLNQEALHRIESAGGPRRRDSKEILRGIRKMRKEMNLPTLTEEFITAAKKEGRM